jgi:hypothetical protein
LDPVKGPEEVSREDEEKIKKFFPIGRINALVSPVVLPTAPEPEPEPVQQAVQPEEPEPIPETILKSGRRRGSC